MTAAIYHIRDYERKEEKLVKRPSLEQLAQDIASQIGGMIGEEVACEMVPYNGQGIDGMKFEPEDCA